MSRAIATFDLTGRCPLRCGHCYFFATPFPEDLPDDEYTARVITAIADNGITSAFWIGGEPLLRRALLRRLLELFPRNAVATSGMLPIPTDWGCAWLVSIDGLAPAHDHLRGTGSFARGVANLSPLPARSFALSTTLTAATLSSIEDLPEVVEQTRALGTLAGFFTGPPDHPLAVTGALREHAVDRLHEVARRHPGVVLNTTAGLDAMRPAAPVPGDCIYLRDAVAYDTHVAPKAPCTFAGYADCAHCGCPVVAEHRARTHGCTASTGLLRALFPRAA